MTKPTFIDAFRKARRRQGAFTGDKNYQEQIKLTADDLYDDFKDEKEADVLHALDRLGKSNEIINYANIKRLVDENRSNREWGKTKKEPEIEDDPTMEEVYEQFPSSIREMFDKLTKDKKMGGRG